MSVPTARRGLCLFGLAFVLLNLIALFLPGPPPKAHDTAAHIAANLAAHRPELMAGMYLSGLALVALIFFLGALRTWLDGAEPGLVLVACAGALLGMGVQVVGLALFYGAAFKVAGQHQDAVVRALTDGGNAAVEMSKFGFAAFIAGVCLAGRRQLGARFTGIGWAAVALLVISAIALVSETAVTQFGSGLDVVGAAPAIVWIAVLSLLMFRREGRLQALRAPVAPVGGTT